jgi:hypothetical protein
MLLFIFATTPNGTIADQVCFIIFNGIGQANLFVYNHISMRRYENSFRQAEFRSDVDTRTRVYGKLIRYFQRKAKKIDRVEKVKLLPDISAWKMWMEEILQGNTKDAKELYDECRGIVQRRERVRERRDIEERERKARHADELAQGILNDAQSEKEDAQASLDSLIADTNGTREAIRNVQQHLQEARDAFELIADARNADQQTQQDHVP